MNPAPVPTRERVHSIDTLRGVALLGILVMNISSFALLPDAYFNPTAHGGFTGLDRVAWYASELFFSQKMMAIFSMLFGAGIIIFTQNASKKGRPIAPLFFRRITLLALIGLAHAYLLWEGDILFTYALCAAAVYPLRKLSARTTATIALAILLLGSVITLTTGASLGYVQSKAIAAQAAADSGMTPTDTQLEFVSIWQEISSDFISDEQTRQDQSDAFTGSYAELFTQRAPIAFSMQTTILAWWSFWRVTGLMLLGMSLFRAGFFSATRSTRTYSLIAAAGFALGIPLIALGAQRQIADGFDFVSFFSGNSLYNYAGSIAVALAISASVMLVCKAGVLTPLRSLLAGVGRTALTNYLLQTIICTTLFYGWGFALWGTLARAQLMLVVLAIWTLQLAITPIWLTFFRYGPAEWLWRSATYARTQPILRTKL